jgi:hypothetical protein
MHRGALCTAAGRLMIKTIELEEATRCAWCGCLPGERHRVCARLADDETTGRPMISMPILIKVSGCRIMVIATTVYADVRTPENALCVLSML